MIRSWGEPADRRLLGNGLIEPDVACLFVGVIGGTQMALLHDARTNPKAHAGARVRALKEMCTQIIETCEAAGCVSLLATTKNDVVARFFAERAGLSAVPDTVYIGRI
jgi:hypothetical protein